MLRLCQVVKRFPERAGVQVLFRDASATGKQANDFVRVLQRRAHLSAGSAVELPGEGELGVVDQIPGVGFIWMGSLHYQDLNQIDGTDGLMFWRHDSGLQFQARPDGSFQVDHPSGTKLAFGPKDQDLPALKASSDVQPGTAADPWIRLTHSSGLALKIDPSGNLTITGLGSVAIGDSNLKRFLMETFVALFNSHTHTSAGSGSPTSSPIVQIQDDQVCSTAKITGQQGS